MMANTKTTKHRAFSFVPLVYIIALFSFLSDKYMLLDYVPIVDFIKAVKISNYSYSLYYLILALLNWIKLEYSLFLVISIIFIFLLIYYVKSIKEYYFLLYIIFFFNPFVYSRLMVGQFSVIIAYALSVIYIFYLLKISQSIKSLMVLSILFSLISSIQPHFGVLLLIASVLWLSSGKVKKKIFGKSFVVLVLFIVLLNANWLQSIFVSSNALSDNINYSHESFFSPKLTQDVPTIVKIMGMWGFWREGAYLVTYNTLPLWLWYSLTLMFPALMLVGHYTKKTKKSKFFFSIWWVGLILATGASHPFTRPLFEFLFNYFPLFNGFRDSHKFSVFICLAYAFLCPLGVVRIRDKVKEITRSTFLQKIIHCAIPLVFVGLIILYSHPLLDLGKQIKPIEFPQSYHQTNEFLKGQDLTGYIIYLPWEAYLTYNWTQDKTPDGRISVPINNIRGPVIETSPGLWGTGNELRKNITNCLNQQSVDCLETQGVQFVLRDKCAFYWTGYEWLNNTVHDDSCISIYELNNKHVDRSTKIPLRFVLGSAISLGTLISMLIYLFIKRQ
jgi:hypothetical protein